MHLSRMQHVRKMLLNRIRGGGGGQVCSALRWEEQEHFSLWIVAKFYIEGEAALKGKVRGDNSEAGHHHTHLRRAGIIVVQQEDIKGMLSATGTGKIREKVKSKIIPVGQQQGLNGWHTRLKRLTVTALLFLKMPDVENTKRCRCGTKHPDRCTALK